MCNDCKKVFIISNNIFVLNFEFYQFHVRSVMNKHHQTDCKGSYWFGVGSIQYLQWFANVGSMLV